MDPSEVAWRQTVIGSSLTISLVQYQTYLDNLVGTYNDLADLMTLTFQGKVTLHTAVYPLDAATDAIHDLDSGKLRGRGILVP